MVCHLTKWNYFGYSHEDALIQSKLCMYTVQNDWKQTLRKERKRKKDIKPIKIIFPRVEIDNFQPLIIMFGHMNMKFSHCRTG